MIKGQCRKKTTSDPIKVFSEKTDGHFKYERMEIIDLLLKPPSIPQIMMILCDMSRELSVKGFEVQRVSLL